ncbi:MAG: hypothetical protein A3J28_15910 [Acidobacteria bacterium RIFCSPLOWO2_12_FULL_60_22]|nr:MAG: hypothetical protein A3J28_15910 [Acidobacteria bacterium RIFCSPLOWO2_12_FULL_60_22]
MRSEKWVTKGLRTSRRVVVCFGVAFYLVFSSVMLRLTVQAQSADNLRGGARGVVRSPAGEPLEGIMVQLASQKSSVRTTVYSNEEGRYEFPQLPAGLYTLRIARPLEFRPYQRDSVPIDGATALEDIVLERVTNSEFLPPAPEIAVQLSGVEWVLSLPGSGEEKKRFINSCTNCHSYYQILRNRHEERGWRLIVERMFRLRHSLETRPGGFSRGATQEDLNVITSFLGRVRGPESKDTPFVILPRPRGAATRVIVTEYEMPHLRLYLNDVEGDSQGNIWFNSERAPYIGKLDPRTGTVKEYRLPSSPGVHPGASSFSIDQNDMIWFSHNYEQKLTRLDPRTDTFHEVDLPPRKGDNPVSMGLGPDGAVWTSWDGMLNKIDPQTGKYLKQYPLQGADAADSLVSADGKYWVGPTGATSVTVLDIPNEKMWEVKMSLPARLVKGGFDPDGNAWFGGRGGVVVKIDPRERRAAEYFPPTPYVTFLEAQPDKNGEVWAGYTQGGRMARFNPRTGRWIEYVMPEHYVRDQRAWIDNSTDPVTVWYANLGGIIRVQPLE